MLLEIIADVTPLDPRSDYDMLGTVVDWHRRYTLGHEKLDDDVEEWYEERLEDSLILPLYIYDHSGIALNTTGFSCPWDSGQVGFIYVSKEKAQEEYGELTKETISLINSVLEAEVETLGHYLNGSVYGYCLYDENKELIDSCWGFFGYDHNKSGLFSSLPSTVDLNTLEIAYV